MRRPKLLDLFCGAGGAAVGYDRAGFDVVGVDHRPMPRFPFAFVQVDALEYVVGHGREYDAIHASPPCHGYSRMRHLPWLRGRVWPLLIDQTRRALESTGLPYVIENVEGAPLNGVTLCGTMFGLRTYRHRRFESNCLLFAAGNHQRHRVAVRHGHGISSPLSDAGWVGASDRTDQRRELGVEWMTRQEARQSIPPIYTEFLGRQLLSYVDGEKSA